MTPERIVVRAPNWIGDVVMSLAALRDLRRAFPASRLEVLARPWVADVYRAVPEVDAVQGTVSPAADVAFMRGRFDLAVLFTNSFGTAWQAWRARVPERWGYAREARGPLLTRSVRVSSGLRGQSEVYYYRAMLAGLGLSVAAPADASLSCPAPWRARGAELLAGRPTIGLNAGAAYGGAKRWVPERFAAVGEALARRHGAAVAFLGGADDRPLAEALAARLEAPVRVLCGETSLGELLGVIANLRLLVSNDSGPMHLASALGVPVAAVFGPTDWRETAPFRQPFRLVRRDVPCSPCKLRECPIDHRCMREVAVDHVLAAAEELLQENP